MLHVITCHYNGGVSLGPTLQLTVRLWGQLQKLVTKFEPVSPASQDVLHQALYGARSQTDLRSWRFSPQQDEETTMISHKPLTDKPYQAPSSCSDKPTELEHLSDPPQLE